MTTAQGSYKHKDTVSSKEPIFEEDGKTVKVPGSITVNGKEITIYAKPKANELPWGELDVDVVLECTGFYTSKAKAHGSYRSWRQEGRHLRSGGQRSADHRLQLSTRTTLTKEDTIISAASCTTNCLAPMAEALNKLAHPIVKGYHDHRPCLHRRSDDSGRPAAQGRPAPCPCRAPSTSSRTPPALPRLSAWLFRN